MTPPPDRHAGLSTAEAAERLARDGPNELPVDRGRTLVDFVLEVLREPMFFLLIASGTIYLFIGDTSEAVALLGAVFIVIGITLCQEQKTERALQALRELSSPRALVLRDGVFTRIAGRNVVVEDTVVLQEGDRVPADGHLLSATNLLVDESLLTGESVPVRKRAGAGAGTATATDAPGGDEHPTVYSGTLVVRGTGTALVTGIGAQTALGRVGKALAGIEAGRTGLQREIDRVVRLLAVVGLGACVAIAIVYGVLRGRWLEGALAGLTLAISMMPEEFVVILTVFLALGAWRISRSQVLTRRLPAIETLGSATVLCVDKTGTLTLNRMAVSVIVVSGQTFKVAEHEDVPDEATGVMRTAILASRQNAIDPMEHAFIELGTRAQLLPDPVSWTLEREYPLSDRLLAVVHAWRHADTPGVRWIATKGAPETVATLCGMSARDTAALLEQVNAMAARGLRVLGVAQGTWDRGDLPGDPAALPHEFVGLIGLADPVRPGVPDAIRECHRAGIRVAMITGDYPSTALNIARTIGLLRTGSCLTGPDIAVMTEDELRQRVEETDVFARMVPDQKLRLVTALRANGEVVAMTGDGVNDAPALKAADIGIAMGGRGTDVAREAAAMVLLDDDFSSIVRAVRLGRRIYDNIQKAAAYVLAIHVPIAGVAIVPVLLGWPLLLTPVHVIFMELIIDPASSIAFEMEPEEADVMDRPPRLPSARLFTWQLALRSVLQGLGLLGACLLVFFGTTRSGLPDTDVRALTFSTLILGNLALIFANRSLTRALRDTWRTNNPALRWITAGAASILAVILYVPGIRDLFKVLPPHLDDLLIIATACAAAVVWMEMVKAGVNRLGV